MDLKTASHIVALDIIDLAHQRFRRDANIKPSPGTVIAEFDNAFDAMSFRRLKGAGYSITAGINLPFAVRIAEMAELLPHGGSL